MSKVRVIVLRAAGINCDYETEYAFESAGAEAERVHVNRLIEKPAILDTCHILVFPGGFSYGDDVAAGKILANQIIHHLSDKLNRFIEGGKLVLGICNGFQVLVKTGILGKVDSNARQQITITYNDSGKFEDRWVYLEPSSKKCIFIEPGRRIYLPIAHGEGKVVFENNDVFEKIKADDRIAFRYVDEKGNQGPYPINPNGSTDSIAALCDSTGRVMGLMPHPERFVRNTQHPHWTRLAEKTRADGGTIFDNAVKYVRQNLL